MANPTSPTAIARGSSNAAGIPLISCRNKLMITPLQKMGAMKITGTNTVERTAWTRSVHTLPMSIKR